MTTNNRITTGPEQARPIHQAACADCALCAASNGLHVCLALPVIIHEKGHHTEEWGWCEGYMFQSRSNFDLWCEEPSQEVGVY